MVKGNIQFKIEKFRGYENFLWNQKYLFKVVEFLEFDFHKKKR